MLVLVILGVLAAIVVPKLAGRSEEAKLKACKAEISILSGALDTFEVDNGRYPTTEEGLRALVEQPANAESWRPYIKGGLRWTSGNTSTSTSTPAATTGQL
jgi:general secretion pathway protein G